MMVRNLPPKGIAQSLFAADYIFVSERPDAEVSALDVLLNNELWTDAISLTAESCKEVRNYVWGGGGGQADPIKVNFLAICYDKSEGRGSM